MTEILRTIDNATFQFYVIAQDGKFISNSMVRYEEIRY